LRQTNEERILILTPIGRDTELVCDLLQNAGLICTGCSTPESFFAALTDGAGALLVTVEALSPSACQTLAYILVNQPAWSDLPLVLLSKRGQEISEAGLRQQLGADVSLTLLERPIQPATLLTLFQSFIQARRRQYQVRDLLAQLVTQTAALQQEVEQRSAIEAEQDRLLHELAQERAQLHQLTQTLEQKVQGRTRQVQSLAAQLSLAEHGERQRVARILHDHVQQMLYAAQFQAQFLDIKLHEMKLSAQNDARMRKYLSEMQRLIDETVHSVRTLSADLSPPVLEHEGLPTALRWLATQMQNRYHLTVWVETEGDCTVADRHLRVVIFQVVRELLFNVVKHADVNEAWIMLRCRDHLLDVTIKDEGAGFDVAIYQPTAQTATGLGLSGIGKRLELFDGNLSIDSAPGAGTVVRLVLPVGG
jgi:signal transduction histidine kinase